MGNIKEIFINDKRFNIVKRDSRLGCVIVASPIRYASLYSCYNNPSVAKVNIFKNWEHWFKTLEKPLICLSYGVISFNSNMFTFGAKVINVNNHETYDIYITPKYNYIVIR